MPNNRQANGATQTREGTKVVCSIPTEPSAWVSRASNVQRCSSGSRARGSSKARGRSGRRLNLPGCFAGVCRGRRSRGRTSKKYVRGFRFSSQQVTLCRLDPVFNSATQISVDFRHTSAATRGGNARGQAAGVRWMRATQWRLGSTAADQCGKAETQARDGSRRLGGEPASAGKATVLCVFWVELDGYVKCFTK